MHSRVTLDQVKSVMAKTELQKKMRDDVVDRLCWLNASISQSKDLTTLDCFMGNSAWLLSFARDNGLISLDEYNDWSSANSDRRQRRMNYFEWKERQMNTFPHLRNQ